MKTIYYFLMLIFVINYSNLHAQGKPKQNLKRTLYVKARTAATTTLTNENQLFLEIFPVEAEDAVQEIQQVTTTFSINNTSLDYSITAITATALANLQLDAAALSTTCQNSVTGVRMIYGVVNGKLAVFYKPVLSCRTGTLHSPTYELHGTYSLTESNEFYRYNSANAFEKVVDATQTATIQAAINSYSNSLRIQVNATTTRTFNPAMDITGDVRSLVYSFQELFSLMTENKTNKLFLWNTVRRIPYTNGAELLKHSILLSPDNITTRPFKERKILVFEQKYANLAHLCPPSCGAYSYRLRP